jgi:MYXO-CTERM domain-containing protein
MRLASPILLSLSLSMLAFLPPADASACGGCFHEMQDMESTQVSGHRMIFSISPTKTTLWDQISYVGNPASFAWVLPVKGTIELGLSSDALFANIELLTQVTVSSPPYTCPPPPFCGDSSSFSASGAGGFNGGGGGDPGTVTVVGQKVVGPYDTVQLSSQDPAALKNWLLDHGYAIPADIAPVIDAYVAEGFDFLALKLVPGKDVKSMRPVRVSTMGAGASLPLRMVAVGAGAKVPITLWVFGEGRYQPANFPWFYAQESQIVWNWDTSSSNYSALVQAGFASTMNHGWLIEGGEPFSQFSISDGLTSLAVTDPAGSGYADEQGMGAVEACAADLDTLFAGIDVNSLWVSRLHGELSREALATDLLVNASSDQSQVKRSFTAPTAVGKGPPCPEYPPCPDTSSSSSGSNGAGGFATTSGSGGGSSASGGGCSIGGERDPGAATFAGLSLAALGLSLARRRKRLGMRAP